jgi:heptaprenyl diphosphate synthase
MGGTTQNIVRFSLIASVGLVLFVVESLLPRPLPWMKLGLGNISSLLALYLFDVRAALSVVAIRSILGALIVGTLLGPTFWLSITGGLSAVMVMATVFYLQNKTFSVVGISIIGALTHTCVQLVIVYAVWIHHFQLFRLLPVMWVSALLTGFLVGAITFFLLQKLEQNNLVHPAWYGPGEDPALSGVPESH